MPFTKIAYFLFWTLDGPRYRLLCLRVKLLWLTGQTDKCILSGHCSYCYSVIEVASVHIMRRVLHDHASLLTLVTYVRVMVGVLCLCLCECVGLLSQKLLPYLATFADHFSLLRCSQWTTKTAMASVQEVPYTISALIFADSPLQSFRWINFAVPARYGHAPVGIGNFRRRCCTRENSEN